MALHAVYRTQVEMPYIGVCSNEKCGARLTSFNAVEVRREYRAVNGLKRMRTWRERWLCRDCAIAEAEEHDRPGGPQSEQPDLFS